MNRYRTLTEAFFDKAGEDNKIVLADSRIYETDYKSVGEKARKFAGYLSDRGIKKGDRIVLAVAELPLFLPAFWGAVYMGAEVIPLIPPRSGVYIKGKQDTKRLEGVLQIAEPVCIISGKGQDLADVIGNDTAIVEVSDEEIENAVKMEAPAETDEDDTAFILFTSGSTGVPKGVAITHRKAVYGCRQNIERFGFTSGSSFLNWLPLEHIASLVLFHIMPCILKARQVQLSTNVVLSDAKELLRYLDRYKIEAAFGPNFIYKMLLDIKDEIEQTDLSLGALRVMIDGSEAIDHRMTQECLDMLKGKGMSPKALIPGWGMTETCVGALYSDNFGKILSGNCVAVGRPVNGAEVRIVKDGELVDEDGTEGSLEIRGGFILDGYLGETEEEHAQRFSADGWFRTGDLAAYSAGEVVITGRESQIYIVNGMNISIAAIEEHISSSLAADGLYTVLKVLNIKDSRTNSDELYVFAEERQGMDRDDIISRIRRYTTERFDISVRNIIFVPENKFPRTAIGKTDTSALIENMKNGSYERGKMSRTPESELVSDEENLLRFIWAEVLDLARDEISVHDDFFEIGGNSAKVPGALGRINKALGTDLDAAEFVRYSTIHKLLGYIHSQEAEEEDDDEMIIL